MSVYWPHINSRNYQKKLVMTLRPVYTYRHRLRLHARHHQSLPFCQWKWTVWWADWVQNPFSPSNSPSLFTQCKFDGHSDGTCKQATMEQNVLLFLVLVIPRRWECDRGRLLVQWRLRVARWSSSGQRRMWNLRMRGRKYGLWQLRLRKRSTVSLLIWFDLGVGKTETESHWVDQ